MAVSFKGAHFPKDVIYRAVDKTGQTIDFLLTEQGLTAPEQFYSLAA